MTSESESEEGERESGDLLRGTSLNPRIRETFEDFEIKLIHWWLHKKKTIGDEKDQSVILLSWRVRSHIYTVITNHNVFLLLLHYDSASFA